MIKNIIVFMFFFFLVKTADAGVDTKLKKQYKAYKKAVNCKFIVTSGKRSKRHNKHVGGAPNSYHLKGKAYDIVPKKSCKKSLRRLWKVAKKYFNGAILYKHHIHVDVRSKKYYGTGKYK